MKLKPFTLLPLQHQLNCGSHFPPDDEEERETKKRKKENDENWTGI